MSDHAAIAAQVVDIRSDDRHKGFIKVTCHVPAEEGQKLTAAMGWPTYVTPVPVAIARLNPNSQKEEPHTENHPDIPTDNGGEAPALEPLARARNPLSQLAGITCNDPLFYRYLEKQRGLKFPVNRDVAAEFVRGFCNVESRSDIVPHSAAAVKLKELVDAFVCWRDYPEMPE